MIGVRYSCDVCGQTYTTIEAANSCEYQDLPFAPEVGTVFRFYFTNRESAVYGVTEVRRKAHSVTVIYVSSEPHSRRPNTDRMWGVAVHGESVWNVLRQLAQQGITPRLAVVPDDTLPERDLKFISIQDVFYVEKLDLVEN